VTQETEEPGTTFSDFSELQLKVLPRKPVDNQRFDPSNPLSYSQKGKTRFVEGLDIEHFDYVIVGGGVAAWAVLNELKRATAEEDVLSREFVVLLLDSHYLSGRSSSL
jgi:hypothetical protein